LQYPPGWLNVADMSRTVVPLVAEATDISDHKDEDRE
jgi:hypothetical protein